MIFWQCSNEDFATPKGESPPATVQCKEILCVHWISPGRKWITSQGFGRKQAEWDWVKVWEKTGVKGWTYWTLCNEWNFPGGSSLNCPEPENEKVKPWWKSLYQLQYKCRVEDHYFGFSEALICLTLPFQDNRFKENSCKFLKWLIIYTMLANKQNFSHLRVLTSTPQRERQYRRCYAMFSHFKSVLLSRLKCHSTPANRQRITTVQSLK